MSEQKLAVKPLWQRSLVALSTAVIAALVLAAMYWMRVVCIPVALAVFFTIVLAPLVTFAQRRGLGRLPAVVLVVTVVSVVLLGTAVAVTYQVAGLSETLTANKDRIKEKVTGLRAAVLGDGESEWAKLVRDVEESLSPAPAGSPPVVVGSSPGWVSYVEGLAWPAAEVLGLIAFALVLTVFMLLSKEELQDRVLRLLGAAAVTSAVRTSGETAARIGRYLFAQLVLNVAFGGLCALGLFLLGVKYALLWGLVAAVMRYVPYLGTWVGVLLPALFAAAVSDGWWQPVGVVVLFLGLEVLTNNLIEPRLYGTRLGVSEVGLLVSAVFWSFLWGPIGLVLSGPLTTLLVVMGRHLPPLRCLAVLLGSDPPLTPALSLYQRLSARNQDEAVRVVDAAILADDPPAVFDAVVLPALAHVKQARQDGQLDADDERQVTAIAREVIDEAVLEVRRRGGTSEGGADDRRVRVLACPAADECDRLSLDALAGLLPAARWEVQVTAVATLTSEVIAAADGFAPDVICVGSLPPSGTAHVRYLCKRLRAVFPSTHILVGRWGEAAVEGELFVEAGASAVVNTLTAAKASLTGWRPVFAAAPPKGDPPAASREAVGTLPA